MALDDIVYLDSSTSTFEMEINVTNTGTLYDIVFDISQIEELVLTGGVAEVSWIF